MADLISDLPLATVLAAADLLEIETAAGISKRAPFSLIGGEFGSNSNGSYVRWQNGLQVCWATNVAQYGLGDIDVHAFPVTFPVAFASLAVVLPSVRGPSGNDFSAKALYRDPTDSGAVLLIKKDSGAGTFNLNYLAIGTWA